MKELGLKTIGLHEMRVYVKGNFESFIVLAT